jgi:hypothetical protein
MDQDLTREDLKLISLYERFEDWQKRLVHTQFEALAKAYPAKNHHQGGYTDLWLTAIADIRDKKSPWI